jgi:hypothetical protein
MVAAVRVGFDPDIAPLAWVEINWLLSIPDNANVCRRFMHLNWLRLPAWGCGAGGTIRSRLLAAGTGADRLADLYTLYAKEACHLAAHFLDCSLVSLADPLDSRFIVKPSKLVVGFKCTDEFIVDQLKDGAATRVFPT